MLTVHEHDIYRSRGLIDGPTLGDHGQSRFNQFLYRELGGAR